MLWIAALSILYGEQDVSFVTVSVNHSTE